jgi:hypothetical protein
LIIGAISASTTVDLDIPPACRLKPSFPGGVARASRDTG